MKKNFVMGILTVVAAFIGVIIAVISFFKNKHFLWFLKSDCDDVEDLDDTLLADGHNEVCGNNLSSE